MKKFKTKVKINEITLNVSYIGYSKEMLVKELDCMVGRGNYKILKRKKIRRKI